VSLGREVALPEVQEILHTSTRTNAVAARQWSRVTQMPSSSRSALGIREASDVTSRKVSVTTAAFAAHGAVLRRQSIFATVFKWHSILPFARFSRESSMAHWRWNPTSRSAYSALLAFTRADAHASCQSKRHEIIVPK
jgi:hypothetical protein